MKAITVAQPWASLITHGHKTIETRPSPPNGPMRPTGVRGLPGARLERGERIAIHAAAGLPDVFDPAVRGGWMYMHRATGEQSIRHSTTDETLSAPLGVVVCTAVVSDAAPVIEPGDDTRPFGAPFILNDPDWGGGPALSLWPGDGSWEWIDATLGDFTPGRWGWLLTDVRRCDPVPCKGRQGVWKLPADVEVSA